MEYLKEQFYDVMHKYAKPFSEKGVMANLTAWWENKRPLVELLRKHPNWDERELAVIFRFSEERAIDHNVVDEAKFEMLELARDSGLSRGAYNDFMAALDEVTLDYSRVPEERRLETIRRRGGINCAPGQKASRIINKLCLHFKLDRYTVEKAEQDEGGHETMKTVCPYNAVFARLADSLNPVHIPKTGVLSVHPCDFLEMSNKDNVWRSCHRLDGSGWQGGCQSYMGDGVSMIFFTVDESVQSDFHKVPRITREIFCYHNGLLLQSRLYPSDDENQRELYRGLVQRTMADCLGFPNLWLVKNKLSEIHEYWSTAPGSLHYQDYENGYAVMSFLKGWEGRPGPLTIGSHTLCTCCGEQVQEVDAVSCRECEKVVLCKECGQEIPKHKAQYSHGAFYCTDCRPVCSHCRTAIEGTVYPATDRTGQPLRLCGDCYEQATAACRNCSVHTVCGNLSAIRFCPRSEVLAGAA